VGDIIISSPFSSVQVQLLSNPNSPITTNLITNNLITTVEIGGGQSSLFDQALLNRLADSVKQQNTTRNDDLQPTDNVISIGTKAPPSFFEHLNTFFPNEKRISANKSSQTKNINDESGENNTVADNDENHPDDGDDLGQLLINLEPTASNGNIDNTASLKVSTLSNNPVIDIFENLTLVDRNQAFKLPDARSSTDTGFLGGGSFKKDFLAPFIFIALAI
jgi:hypothetical protein